MTAGQPEESKDVDREGLVTTYTALEIRAALDERVVGQAQAKTALSHLLAMHLTWFRNPDPLHTAPNALLIGSTGVGKTHTIETAANMLRVPLAVVEAARLMPSIGSGELSFDDIFSELIRSAERLISGTEEMTRTTPVDLARRGIVFLDEFDKLRLDPRGHVPSNFILQRTLLQVLEGARVPVRVPSSKPGEPRLDTLDTRGILFIASGAFEGIRDESIRARRPQEISRQGIPSEIVIASDIHAYGFLPEVIARMPVFIHFEDLQVPDLVEILDNPLVDPATVYRNYLKNLKVDLQLTSEAKRYVAEQAVLLKMGARGLHQILFPMLAALSERAATNPPDILELDDRMARRLMSGGR